MTTHEFDERLSAYLDGKLSASEKMQFEAELQQNPQLRGLLERLKKLDQLARQSQIDMPAEGYFDGLAGRIDAKLERNARPKRGFASAQPIMPRGRLIAILSSVAAVFVVVVAVYQLWKPETERYYVPKSVIVNPPQKSDSQPPQNALPAIATEPLTESNKMKKQEIPDTVLGKVIESDQKPEGVKDEEYTERPVFPEHQDVKQTSAVSQESIPPTTIAIDTATQQLQPSGIEIVRIVDSSAYRGTAKPVAEYGKTSLATESNVTGSVLSQPTLETGSVKALHSRLVTSHASIPLALDSLQSVMPAEALQKGIPSDTFDPAVFEQRVQALLDSGKYVPVRFVAWDKGENKRTSLYDVEQGSLQNWYDSLHVMGTEQWQAENAYREASRSRGSRLAECITARLYIEHYLRSGDVRDTNLWQERLDEVRQWEQEIRK